MRMIDLTGQRFGRLTVIEYAGQSKQKTAMWKCQCDCGNTVTVRSICLRKGDTQSCGCYAVEQVKKANTKHGMKTRASKPDRIYNIWNSMKGRCQNPNNDDYEHYGGRGIVVCEEWQEFEPFYDLAMANGYEKNLTIDRINVNGNYEPSNCRWADVMVQNNNKNDNRYITANGETHTLAEWGRIAGIKPDTIAKRMKKGWSVEDAVTTPKRGVKHG